MDPYELFAVQTPTNWAKRFYLKNTKTGRCSMIEMSLDEMESIDESIFPMCVIDYLLWKLEPSFTKEQREMITNSLLSKEKGVVKIQDNSTLFSNQSNKLPSMSALVKCPCEMTSCQLRRRASTLRSIIIHLNDQCRWKRKRIADWLDELHDDGKINIEFQPWGESND